MDDHTITQILLTVFTVAILFSISVVKTDTETIKEQEQQVEYYKAKADSALLLAEQANTLTNQCIELFTEPTSNSLYERSSNDD